MLARDQAVPLTWRRFAMVSHAYISRVCRAVEFEFTDKSREVHILVTPVEA